jgi:hypothetical protein
MSGPTLAYEVDAEFLQLLDPAGHKHYLSRGRALPEWVAADTIDELVKAGAVSTFGVI